MTVGFYDPDLARGAQRYHGFDDREMRVWFGRATGKTVGAIALQEDKSDRAINGDCTRLYEKLGVESGNVAGLTCQAITYGLIPPPAASPEISRFIGRDMTRTPGWRSKET